VSADENNQDLERQEVRQAEIHENNQWLSDELRILTKEKDELQRHLNETQHEAGKSQRENEKLNSQINSMSGALDEEIKSLQDKLTTEEEKRITSNEEVLARDKRIASLEGELKSGVEELAAAGLEVVELTASLEEVRTEIEILEQGKRDQEQEVQHEHGKLQSDIQQKNAEEKVLQSQIDELRRKSAQSADDLQAARDSARDEIAKTRKELGDERSARDAEREEMMQHQQQLKQQLSEISSQHEEYKSDREAALQDIVDDARRDEQAALEKQVEDPGKLRAELAETKRNIEISVRLRAEAERERDKARQEVEDLLQQLKRNRAEDTKTGTPSAPKAAGTEKNTAQPASGLFDFIVDTNGDNKYRWLGASIGLGVVAVVVLLLWVLLQPDDNVTATVVKSLPEDSKILVKTDRKSIVIPQAAVKAPQEETASVVSESETKPEPEARPVTLGTFRDTLLDGGRGPQMVKLPAAAFMMGSTGNSINFDEGPRHKVNVPQFSISKHEVTFAEYDRFARAAGRRLPYDEDWGRGTRPVVNVNWSDAADYAFWLSKQTGKDYRLPSEAQWEFAARAGSNGAYWWGDKAVAGKGNCFDCGSEWGNQSTAEVGSFGANAFGLHDTAGNVQEWTDDCYHRGYMGAPTDASARIISECTQRVVRGGSYTSPQDSLRTARRGQYHQDTRLDNLGFRVVRLN
jgi:formylglycine-generating enzyme required for sulfatase activity